MGVASRATGSFVAAPTASWKVRSNVVLGQARGWPAMGVCVPILGPPTVASTARPTCCSLLVRRLNLIEWLWRGGLIHWHPQAAAFIGGHIDRHNVCGHVWARPLIELLKRPVTRHASVTKQGLARKHRVVPVRHP